MQEPKFQIQPRASFKSYRIPVVVTLKRLREGRIEL